MPPWPAGFWQPSTAPNPSRHAGAVQARARRSSPAGALALLALAVCGGLSLVGCAGGPDPIAFYRRQTGSAPDMEPPPEAGTDFPVLGPRRPRPEVTPPDARQRLTAALEADRDNAIPPGPPLLPPPPGAAPAPVPGPGGAAAGAVAAAPGRPGSSGASWPAAPAPLPDPAALPVAPPAAPRLAPAPPVPDEVPPVARPAATPAPPRPSPALPAGAPPPPPSLAPAAPLPPGAPALPSAAPPPPVLAPAARIPEARPEARAVQ